MLRQHTAYFLAMYCDVCIVECSLSFEQFQFLNQFCPARATFPRDMQAPSKVLFIYATHQQFSYNVLCHAIHHSLPLLQHFNMLLLAPVIFYDHRKTPGGTHSLLPRHTVTYKKFSLVSFIFSFQPCNTLLLAPVTHFFLYLSFSLDTSKNQVRYTPP